MQIAVLRGGIHITGNHSKNAFEAISELEKLETEKCNIPVIFAEMFKDEINANDEEHLYSQVKKFIKKYSEDRNVISIINEFTEVLSGGASLEEILQITVDEARHPSAATDITVSEDCELH